MALTFTLTELSDEAIDALAAQASARGMAAVYPRKSGIPCLSGSARQSSVTKQLRVGCLFSVLPTTTMPSRS
jgi:hypothetical protein